MYILDSKKRAVIWGSISIFCIVFFSIYNRYSHGVHSPFMTYFFAVPLIFGCLPNCIAAIFGRKIRTRHIASGIYCAGIAAVTVSCVLRGIFEIAGTSSVYQTVLMWFGIAMSAVGAAVHTICLIKNAGQNKKI